jgi:flagellar biosynthesis chaperone FliJ
MLINNVIDDLEFTLELLDDLLAKKKAASKEELEEIAESCSKVYNYLTSLRDELSEMISSNPLKDFDFED